MAPNERDAIGKYGNAEMRIEHGIHTADGIAFCCDCDDRELPGDIFNVQKQFLDDGSVAH